MDSERGKTYTAEPGTGEREERVKETQEDFNERITQLVERLNAIDLADGVDKNSWIYAGCIQDLEKARTRILAYIERCLR